MGNKWKMLCFDLDDTLLRTDKTISDYSIRILNKWTDKGGLIVFATARSRFKTVEFSENIKIEGLIALSGAFAYKGSEIIKDCCIDRKTVEVLKDYCTKYDGNYMSVFLENKILTNFKPFLEHGDCEYTDFKEVELKKVGKILLMPKNSFSKKSLELFENCRYTKDQKYGSYSIYNKKANKIEALSKLVDLLQIDLKNVICFGNDDNDIPMLQKAGIGVAVLNATENLKKVANVICLDNNHDGPARWIEENLL